MPIVTKEEMELSEHFSKISSEISRGMKPGSYLVIKKAYPKFFSQINEELEKDFTIEGMNKYRDTIIRGLKKEGLWNE